MKYNLTKGWYIRKLDPRNWVIAKMNKYEGGRFKGEEYETIDGYFSTLEASWRAAVDKLALKASDHKELTDIITDLHNLKFFKQHNGN